MGKADPDLYIPIGRPPKPGAASRQLCTLFGLNESNVMFLKLPEAGEILTCAVLLASSHIL